MAETQQSTIWKYCERYQAAKDEGDFDAAYKSIFQLRVEDQVDEEGSKWQEFVESKRSVPFVWAGLSQDLQTALTPCVHQFCRQCLDPSGCSAEQNLPCLQTACLQIQHTRVDRQVCDGEILCEENPAMFIPLPRLGPIFHHRLKPAACKVLFRTTRSPTVLFRTPLLFQKMILFRTLYCSKNKDKFCE